VEAAGYSVLVVCVILGATYLCVAIHEGAHALVALAVGLRVKSVQIVTRHPATLVVPTGRALPARMAAVSVAGPMADAAFAAALWWLADQPFPKLVEIALRFVAAFAALVALGNLLPVRIASRPTDGYNLLRWIFWPDLTTAENSADFRQLETIIATTQDPRILLAAVRRRHAIDPTGYAEFITDADRLLAIARDEHTDRAAAGDIALWLALEFGFGYLHMAIVAGEPIDGANREEIIETAELAARLAPKSKLARVGLAIVRLLDDRPAQARDLLLKVTSRSKAEHAVVLSLFAVALTYLGNRARATAVLASAPQPANPLLHAIVAQLRAATELPPLRRPDSEPAVPAAAQQSSSASN
jgi:hypothetical protein